MSSFHPATLLCAAALMLTCSACTVPPTQSVSTPPPSDLSEPDTSATSVITPEPELPDESSAPVIFVPDPPASQPPAPPAKEAEPVQPSIPEQTAPAADLSQPEPPQLQEQEKCEETPEQEQEPKEPVSEQVVPTQPQSDYDFSQPVPECEPVDSDYFSDAAFVGDSRSEGFYLYAVKRGKNLSSSGLSVFNLAQKKCFSINGTRSTALDVLSQKEYAKIYLGFGVNELGYINADAFYQSYCETIDAVRACQPHAVVYAQTMAPVNEARVAATGGKKHLNNDRVRLYNDLIRKAALEKQIPLLDIYSALAVDGSLPAEASRDGVHLTGDYCRKQLEYLKSHTISFESLYSPPETEPEVLPDETLDVPDADPVPDADAGSLLPQPEQSSVPSDPDRLAFDV